MQFSIGMNGYIPSQLNIHVNKGGCTFYSVLFINSGADLPRPRSHGAECGTLQRRRPHIKSSAHIWSHISRVLWRVRRALHSLLRSHPNRNELPRQRLIIPVAKHWTSSLNVIKLYGEHESSCDVNRTSNLTSVDWADISAAENIETVLASLLSCVMDKTQLCPSSWLGNVWWIKEFDS